MEFGRKDYDKGGLIVAGTTSIAEEEPVFILRAQDIAAPAAIRAWVKLAKSLGASAHILESAESLARAMEGWPLRKLADMPESAGPLFDE